MGKAPAPTHCGFPMEPVVVRTVPIWKCQVCDRVEPRATDPKCDFCSDANVVTNEVALDFMVNPGPVGKSVGAWGACQECHDLIAQGKWGELEDRAYRAMRRKFPRPSNKDIRFAVQAIQRQFRIHAGAETPGPPHG
jgi:hypothetical protein